MGTGSTHGSREERFALAALATIGAITAAWWALALWPVPTDGAPWLLRTRAVCFGATDSGLPDAAGWALLVGQPLGMTLVLLVGWRRATAAALRRLARARTGRAVLVAAGLAGVTGAGAAAVRVADAASAPRVLLDVPARDPAAHPTLDRAMPTTLSLTDHRGRPFSLDSLRGRPVLVTFAFAHCETVCPVLVREVLEAQRIASEGVARGIDPGSESRSGSGPGTANAGERGRPAVVVVTVDPWRDTPSRLSHVARQWGLPEDARLLGGTVEAVVAELDAWDVSIRRDRRTGEITHPALVYVLDAAGRLRFAATGGGTYLAELVSRL